MAPIDDKSDDDALFREAMAGVTPLERKSRVRPARAGRTRAKARPAPRLAVSGREGRAPGVNDRQLTDLRGGRVPVGRTLDLHGLRSDPARHAIQREVARAADDRVRCILMVHGKGRHSGGVSVLADLAVQTLAAPPAAAKVLAFCPALPRDGGDGALYVLIRRPK